MKKIMLVLGVLLTFGVFGSKSLADVSDLKPTSEYYYLDTLNILSQDTKNEIISVNKKYETTEEKPQIVVVTTKDLVVDLDGEKVFKQFEIGNSDYDNGILILYSENETETNIRIEVGYGLEGAMPDVLTQRILMDKKEELKSKDPTQVNDGLQYVFNQVAQHIDKEYDFNFADTTNPLVTNDVELTGGQITMIIIIVIAVIVGWVILYLINPELAMVILELVVRILLSAAMSGGKGSSGGSSGGHGGGGRSGSGGSSI